MVVMPCTHIIGYARRWFFDDDDDDNNDNNGPCFFTIEFMLPGLGTYYIGSMIGVQGIWSSLISSAGGGRDQSGDGAEFNALQCKWR